MVYDTAKLLANELKSSIEYREYAEAKARGGKQHHAHADC